MSFSPEAFDQQIGRLTDPRYGLVRATEEPDIFGLQTARPPQPDAPNKLVIITGPSRAGKDTIISALLDKQRYGHVRTATTREPRENESEGAYTWMRKKRDDESNEEYLRALIEEYGLIEHDVHHEDVYGLPYENLSTHDQGKIPLLNTDTRGIVTLKERLEGQFAVASILVCPENAATLERRMAQLGQKSLGRLATAQAYLSEAPACVDYVLHNRTATDVPRSISIAADQIDRLIARIFT